MTVAYVSVIGVTILANAGVVAADLAKARFVLNNSAELGLPRSWLPYLAALKAAGAVGLLLGFLGIPVVGVAAAAGLVAFFAGAVIVHLRTRVFYNIAFPCLYLALAVASLAFSIAH